MKVINWKIGMSSCCTNSADRATFEAYAENGIDYMEVSLPEEAYSTVDIKEIGRLSVETGVKLWSFHLPFYPPKVINIASTDKVFRKKCVEMQSDFIRRIGDEGIGIAVIHPSSGVIKEAERSEAIKCSCDSLAKLAEIAEKNGVTIAAENLPRQGLGNTAEEMKLLLSADNRLRFCFDTNHSLEEHYTNYIKLLGNRIATIHVSDYDFLNERHWLPYEGKIDWVQTVGLLEKAGYRGPFMYEVSLSTPETIARRDLTFKDFKENFTACVNKYPFNAFGKPISEKCQETAFYKTPKIIIPEDLQ